MTDLKAVSVENGRIYMPDVLSAQLGIPNGIEFWRYNLARASADPHGYARAMATMSAEDLHFLLTLYDNLELIVRRHPGLIVPMHLTDDLHGILDRVRADIRSEAAHRNLNLIPWSAAPGASQ